MRAPISWVAEYVELPETLSARELGDALVRVGLEVERVESAADGITGPIVVGRVLNFVEEPQKNGKSIRWCQLEVGESEPRGIVCGAKNFAVGDLVVVSLPGAVLPGPFAIAARKTYGHVSDGMICSVRELGIGDEHDGILVLDPGTAEPGADALDVLGLRDAVLDIAVTPDRGYCLSVRGLAREAAVALDLDFEDVADTTFVPAPDDSGYPVHIDVEHGCDQFSARTVTGVDPTAPSPAWMRQRLVLSGMRAISLVVDVTNYVMLETGQPLHAFDRSKLSGPLGVRRAVDGEKLETLDGVVRVLHHDDLLVTDDSGPLALAGVMGGATTEIGSATRDIVLEAAHWDPASISRSVRRHKLPSEAAKRFERGVDPAIAEVALQRCVDLLIEHGGASADPGFTVIGPGPDTATILLNDEYPARLAGMAIGRETVITRLKQVGCEIAADDDDVHLLHVLAPTWRPDLVDPAGLVEEVVRLEGYDRIPSVLPTPPPGRGLTEGQKARRAVSRALAAAGFVEVLSYPFVSPTVHDAFGLTPEDPRRRAARLVNPLSENEPELRTSLLPGLLATLSRNVGRGNRDLALFEMGLVYLPRADAPPVPRPGVQHRPSDDEIAALNAAIPVQPRHAAVVLAGDVELPGWWGPARRANWSDAVEAARTVATSYRADLVVRAASVAPWHPGRCAELVLDGAVIGHAGELHPRVVTALGLPERTVAMELDLDAFVPPVAALTPSISAYPPVLLDLALVVEQSVASADLLETVRAGAGPLLETVRLFDLYADPATVGPGRKSIAFALRLRAHDRTLTVEEATVARDAAIALAGERHGAVLRT